MKNLKYLFLVITIISSVSILMATTVKNILLKQTFTSSIRLSDKPTRTSALAEVQTNTFSVVEDTYLNGSSETRNYGANANLVVKQTSTSSNTYNRLTLLKFDISGIDRSKGRIARAELRLFIKSTDALNSGNLSHFQTTPHIVAYSKEDTWSANTIAWNNYASYAQSASEVARVTGSAVPRSGHTIIANSEITWDITSTVRKDFINDAAKTLSLALTSTSDGANVGATFHSKENGSTAFQPKLVIYQNENIPFSLPEDSEPTLFDKVLENITNSLYDEVGNYNIISTNAQNYLSVIQSNGSWTDITYTGDVATDHLDRLKTMAIAYTNAQSTLYQNTSLYTGIINGLRYWHNQNPNHSNWFYDQIAYPQIVGEILVLMRNGLQKTPAVLEYNMLLRMKNQGGAPDQSGSQGTGANKMNIAMHWIYRGCLAEDKSILDKGVQQAFFPLSLTTGEGLQHDYSYLQHGQQLYIGGYGWDIANVATKVALYVVETPYADGNDKLDFLSSFLRQSYLRVIRGQNFMFNAFGRGIARPNGSNQSGFTTLLNRMKVFDPTYTGVYNAAIARLNNSQPASFGVEAAHTYFYRADYTLQTKPAYTFELRTVSTRTLRNENGNGENVKGYFLSDGATSIAVTGTEYVDIYPTWDWSMIPGTTTKKGTMVTPPQWGTPGTTTFVGGVSDTTRGISVYDLNNNSTQAKKAWFFFDDEVVCLGTGISATGTQEVNTTLNQCLLQGDVITSTTGGVVNTYSGNSNTLNYSNNLEWAVQGNVGYVLPNGGNVGLTAISQTGKWSTINTSASTTDVSKDVFTLWFKHGLSPSNDSYSYIVVPNKSTAAQMQSYVAQNNIQILQNTNQIQAVKHKNLNLHGFVFHSSNQTFANDTISVNANQPCLLMVQPMPNGKLKLNISDPTKTLTTVTLNIKWTGESAAKQVTVNLPTATEEAGKSMVAYITPENVLPLRLLTFTAKREISGVNLKWTSTNESNVDRIEIWRKNSDNNATLIDKLKAKNVDAGTNNYNYTDKTSDNSELYYQLKIVDTDGSTNTSDFVVVPKIAAQIMVYPNPTNKYIYVKLEGKQLIKIYNTVGRLLLETTVSDNQPIDISKFPTGLYVITVDKKQIKFIISK